MPPNGVRHFKCLIRNHIKSFSFKTDGSCYPLCRGTQDVKSVMATPIKWWDSYSTATGRWFTMESPIYWCKEDYGYRRIDLSF